MASKIVLPTVYELASLATQLHVATPEKAPADFVRQLNSAVQKAETLWLLSREKVSQIRLVDASRKQFSEKAKRILEKSRLPKSFPTSMETIIRYLLPKRSKNDRKIILEKFIGDQTKDDWDKAFSLTFKTDISEFECKQLVVFFFKSGIQHISRI